MLPPTFALKSKLDRIFFIEKDLSKSLSIYEALLVMFSSMF